MTVTNKNCLWFPGWFWLWQIIRVGDALTDPLMRSFLIQVCHVFFGYSLKMFAFMNEDMIQAFSPPLINLLQIPLACGVKYSVLSSLMSELTATVEKCVAYFLSRSQIRYFSTLPHGVASLNCYAVHSLIGHLWDACMHDPTRFQFHHYKDISLNQVNRFGWNLWFAFLAFGFPPPIHAKQFSMPAHESFWLNNMNRLFSEFRKVGKKNGMNTIRVGEPRLLDLPI